MRPGDLITSDFMRRLLGGLAGIEEYLGRLDGSAGIGSVPDVIFSQLSTALTVLRGNNPPLQIAGAFDPFGNKINLNDDSFRGERVVLAQFPVPGTRVAGGQSVKLLVSTETSTWMMLLEMVADRGPDLIAAWRNWRFERGESAGVAANQRNAAGAAESVTASPSAAAEPVTATASAAAEPTSPTAGASASSAAAPKSAAKKTTKARAGRKQAKPVE